MKTFKYCNYNASIDSFKKTLNLQLINSLHEFTFFRHITIKVSFSGYLLENMNRLKEIKLMSNKAFRAISIIKEHLPKLDFKSIVF